MHVADTYLNIIIVLPGSHRISLESHRFHLTRLVGKEKVLGWDIIGQAGPGSIDLRRGRIKIDLHGLPQDRFEGGGDLDGLALRRILRAKADPGSQDKS
jgi:hypothetical protein